MMKAIWILIFFLVGLSTLSDCRRSATKIRRVFNRHSGGVSGRRSCVGQLSLYQGETLLEQIEAFVPDVSSYQVSNHEKENDSRIDSFEVTGDCCWDIESNNGDFETVYPGHTIDISMFLSQLSPEY